MVPAALSTERLARAEAVVIGASAGGVEALLRLLPELPANGRLPVIAVLHLLSGAPSLLVELLAPRCALPVRHPVDKEPVAPGVWLARPDYHLLVEDDRTFSVSVDDPVNFSRPSIDVLFDSAARVYGDGLAALILTGAGRDGAEGARSVRARGGIVLVEDPVTAEIDAMPRAAIAVAEPHLVAPLPALTAILRDMCRGPE